MFSRVLGLVREQIVCALGRSEEAIQALKTQLHDITALLRNC